MLLIYFILLVLLLTVSAGAQKIGPSFSYRSSFYTNTITGNTNRTYLQGGGKSIHDLTFGYLADLSGGRSLELNFEGRQINDTNISSLSSEITRYLTKYQQGEAYELAIGNRLYSSFSQYSLAQSFEGLLGKGTVGLGKMGKMEITGISGQSSKPQEGSRFARSVSGIRMENSIGTMMIGANYVRTYDEIDSITNKAGLSAADNSVTSLDSSLTWGSFGNLNIKGEIAFSTFNSGTELKGKAANLKVDFRHGIFDVDTSYERVGTNFYTLSAGAARDQVRYYANLGLHPHPRFSARGGYETYYNNNANPESPSTLFVKTPTIFLNFIPFSHWNNFNLSVAYRNQEQKSNDGSTNNVTSLTNINLSNYWGDNNLGIGYNTSQYRNVVSDTYNMDTYSLRMNFGNHFTLRSIKINPSLFYTTTNTKYINTGRSGASDTKGIKLNTQIGEFHFDSDYQNSNNTYTSGDTLGSNTLYFSLRRKTTWRGNFEVGLDYRSTTYLYSDTSKNYSTSTALSRLTYAF